MNTLFLLSDTFKCFFLNIYFFCVVVVGEKGSEINQQVVEAELQSQKEEYANQAVPKEGKNTFFYPFYFILME